MRAEVQTIVDEIKQSIGLLRRHLLTSTRHARASELNKQAEDPRCGTSQRPSLMQERTALEEQLTARRSRRSSRTSSP